MIQKFYYGAAAVVLIVLGIIFYFNTQRTQERPVNEIVWNERALVWDDFQESYTVGGDYDAAVYTGIYFPNDLSPENSFVYAYMLPHLSERTPDAHIGEGNAQLLIHEQYHFNVTEYHARLLRKAILALPKEDRSARKIKKLGEKYQRDAERMQVDYDNLTEHNVAFNEQRFWELKLDDLLRQTAYYKNPDLNSYYAFQTPETTFYRKAFQTIKNEVLVSYPILPEDTLYGRSYQIIKKGDITTIKYRLNGALTNGGAFESAITVIDKSNDNITYVRYFNKDSTYNMDANYAILENKITAENKLISTYFNEEGKRVPNRKNDPHYGVIFEKKWDFNDDWTLATVRYYDATGNPVAGANGIYQQTRKYDDLGRNYYVATKDIDGNFKNDEDYAAEFYYLYDNYHNVTEIGLYDAKQRFAVYNAEFNIKYEYDERGNNTRKINLNTDGDPAPNSAGTAIYDYTYDLYDNTTSSKRLDSDGDPYFDVDNNYHYVTDFNDDNKPLFAANYNNNYVLKFADDRSGATRVEHLNDSIRLEYNVDGYNYTFDNDSFFAIRKITTNADGNDIRVQFLNEFENAAVLSNGVHEYLREYDAKGNMTMERAQDSLHNPVAFEGKVAQIRWKYDARNNKTETSYYNTDNKPQESILGIFKETYTYDQYNNNTAFKHLDKNNRPASKDGVHKILSTFDAYGREIATREYDRNNKLTKTDGETRYTYNEYGNMQYERYYGANGVRINNREGYSGLKLIYDDLQRHIGYEFINTLDQVTNTNDGYAIQRRKLNKDGYNISTAYFDVNNNPVIGPDGNHKVVYDWNAMGLSKSVKTYGADEKLMPDYSDIAVYEYTYFPSGMVKSLALFDEKYQRMEDEYGVSMTEYEHSMNGLYYTLKEFKANGEEIPQPEEEITELESLYEEETTGEETEMDSILKETQRQIDAMSS